MPSATTTSRGGGGGEEEAVGTAGAGRPPPPSSGFVIVAAQSLVSSIRHRDPTGAARCCCPPAWCRRRRARRIPYQRIRLVGPSNSPANTPGGRGPSSCVWKNAGETGRRGKRRGGSVTTTLSFDRCDRIAQRRQAARVSPPTCSGRARYAGWCACPGLFSERTPPGPPSPGKSEKRRNRHHQTTASKFSRGGPCHCAQLTRPDSALRDAGFWLSLESSGCEGRMRAAAGRASPPPVRLPPTVHRDLLARCPCLSRTQGV